MELQGGTAATVVAIIVAVWAIVAEALILHGAVAHDMPPQ